MGVTWDDGAARASRMRLRKRADLFSKRSISLSMSLMASVSSGDMNGLFSGSTLIRKWIFPPMLSSFMVFATCLEASLDVELKVIR